MKLMPKLLTGLFALSLVVLFTSCQPEAAVENLALTKIPTNATAVTVVDIPSLMEKADFEAVKQMQFYKEMLREVDNPDIAQAMEDPEKAGIDLSQPAYIYYTINPEDVNETFFAVVMAVKDKASLENILSKSDVEKKKGNGFSYSADNDQSILAWSDNLCLLGGSPAYMDLTQEAENFFQNDGSENISQNKDFQKAMANKHDISSWANLDAIAENGDAQLALAFASIDPEALKGNSFHSYLDFEKGEVNSETKWFLQSGLIKDLQKLFKDNPSTDFSKYFSGENLAFFLSTAIDLKGLNEVLNDRPQAKGFLDYSIQEFGFTVEDLVKSFGGDIALGLYPTESESEATGLFAMSVEKEDVLQQFLDLGEERGLIVKVRDNYYKLNNTENLELPTNPTGAPVKFDGEGYLLLKDGHAFISGNESVLAEVESGKFKGAKKVKNLTKDNLFAIYFNYLTSKSLFGPEDEQPKGVEEIESSINRDGARFNVEMDKKDVNSLKYIFQIVEEEYQKHGAM